MFNSHDIALLCVILAHILAIRRLVRALTTLGGFRRIIKAEPWIGHETSSVVKDYLAMGTIALVFGIAISMLGQRLLFSAEPLVLGLGAIALGLFGLYRVPENFFVLADAAQNTIALINAELPEPFILYLRDRKGEFRTRTVLIHDDRYTRTVELPNQLGADLMQETFEGKIPMFALCDLKRESRDSFPFRPIISQDVVSPKSGRSRWQDDIEKLMQRACLIAIDVGDTTPGLMLEASMVSASPALLEKTLVIASEDDERRYPMMLASLKNPRWKVTIPDRSNSVSGRDPSPRPTEALRQLSTVRQELLAMLSNRSTDPGQHP